MKLIRTAIVLAGCLAFAAGAGAQGDPLLGKGKGKGPGKPPVSTPPPRSTPPPQKAPPPRTTPPPQKAPPPRQVPPPRSDPPKSDPLGKGAPPRTTPPRNEPPPRVAPPRNEPPPRVAPPPQRGGSDDRSGPPLGRIDPPRNQDVARPQVGNDSLLGRRQNDASRSGTVRYGTVNNVPARSTSPQVIRTDNTIIDLRTGSLQFQVRREENVRYARNYRSGYVQYDSRWCDDYFYYPHYRFTPVYNQCVISPWYYYPQLPGYILNSRIIVIDTRPFQFYGTIYNWSRPRSYGDGYGYGYGYRATELDYALDDLVTGFERGDRRSLTRLVPRRGRVAIALEGRYAYTLDPDDFYDMLLDAALSTRTYRYDVLEVRTYRDEATVVARHEYVDPWGREARVYHYLRLENERGDYVIREFGTSSRRGAY